jgi:DNA-binding NarL/FixJ family response regulator
MASTPPLRVMLVDDHEVVRDGIKALLAPNDDIVVCAEAATVRQAVAEADRSPQEERVLELVSTGRTNKQIGEELHLAEKTVKNYVSSILAKLEVVRRAEAASYVTRHTTTPGS